MQPPFSLPGVEDSADFVEKILSFVSSHEVFRQLVGGVHILDFATSEPDLYATVIPSDWREWFASEEMPSILDILLDKTPTMNEELRSDDIYNASAVRSVSNAPPPATLVEYLQLVRSLNVKREFLSPSVEEDGFKGKRKIQGTSSASGMTAAARRLATGMSFKKAHEVLHFSAFIEQLVQYINSREGPRITHIIDFGSGQSYLGRTLASRYGMHVIGVEGRRDNIEGSKDMDVVAQLASRNLEKRNKKEWANAVTQDTIVDQGRKESLQGRSKPQWRRPRESSVVYHVPSLADQISNGGTITTPLGTLQHVHTSLSSGDLSDVLAQIPQFDVHLAPNVLVVSLHSCGDLTHHALRSLYSNSAVVGVAAVGCCYNLLTESVAPKCLNIKPYSSVEAGVEQLTGPGRSTTPLGFPMSRRLTAGGIGLNITARMLGVQAPYTWSANQSQSFFRRHFYRAVLQRMLLDKGIVGRSDATRRAKFGGRSRTINVMMSTNNPVDVTSDSALGDAERRGGPAGGTATEPVVIGGLKKDAYSSFPSYARAAVTKLLTIQTTAVPMSEGRMSLLRERMQDLPEEELHDYVSRYAPREKDLMVMWTLMAVSATVVENLILVDRWLWLKEQQDLRSEPDGGTAWLQPVFDYNISPRNVCVVGIKGTPRQILPTHKNVA